MQSDAALLRMKLKASSKKTTIPNSASNDPTSSESGQQATTLSIKQDHSIHSCSGTRQEVENWIDSVRTLHEVAAKSESQLGLSSSSSSSSNSAGVNKTSAMLLNMTGGAVKHANIDQLMEEWHRDVEIKLQQDRAIPGPELDVTLDEYVAIMLGE